MSRKPVARSNATFSFSLGGGGRFPSGARIDSVGRLHHSIPKHRSPMLPRSRLSETFSLEKPTSSSFRELSVKRARLRTRSRRVTAILWHANRTSCEISSGSAAREFVRASEQRTDWDASSASPFSAWSTASSKRRRTPRWTLFRCGSPIASLFVKSTG